MDKQELFFNINNALWHVGNSVLGLFRIPKAVKERKVIERNGELGKYKKSKRCYILGLGPSIKGVDFSKLDGDLIATNRFFKFDVKAEIHPAYYVLADRAFYGGYAQNDLKQAMEQYPDACWVLNGLYRPWCEAQMDSKMQQTYYFYMWNGGVCSKQKIDLKKVLPAVNNIVHVAIMLALHCQYEEIILLGCDFSSFASSVASHCYKDEKTMRLWKMDFELYMYSLAAHAHVELRRYADKNGIKILNATRGSLLDAYDFDFGEMEKIYYKEQICKA